MMISYCNGRLKHKGEGVILPYHEINKTRLSSVTKERLRFLEKTFNFQWQDVYVVELKQYEPHSTEYKLVQSVCIVGFYKGNTIEYVRKEYSSKGAGTSFIYINGSHKSNATTVEALGKLYINGSKEEEKMAWWTGISYEFIQLIVSNFKVTFTQKLFKSFDEKTIKMFTKAIIEGLVLFKKRRKV